ncbi:unnamed protein product, partial [Rotaria magnacalcarata]
FSIVFFGNGINEKQYTSRLNINDFNTVARSNNDNFIVDHIPIC